MVKIRPCWRRRSRHSAARRTARAGSQRCQHLVRPAWRGGPGLAAGHRPVRPARRGAAGCQHPRMAGKGADVDAGAGQAGLAKVEPGTSAASTACNISGGFRAAQPAAGGGVGPKVERAGRPARLEGPAPEGASTAGGRGAHTSWVARFRKNSYKRYRRIHHNRRGGIITSQNSGFS